jgi:shikimate kinase
VYLAMPTTTQQAQRVALVGFMGAGKTSVGRELARRLRWRFVDLDDVIVAAERRSIAEIFRDAGEPAFRRAETAALRAVLRERGGDGLVLALGGGAYVQPRNVELLQRAGVPVIFLDAAPEVLLERCAASGVERPLLRDTNQFRQLYAARRVRYMRAEVRIASGGRTLAQTAAEAERWLRRRLRGAGAGGVE